MAHRIKRECVCVSAPTSDEVAENLFEHGPVDLGVCDGVEHPALFRVGEDDLAELLPVYLTVLQQDLPPEVLHQEPVRSRLRLHHCQTHTL